MPSANIDSPGSRPNNRHQHNRRIRSDGSHVPNSTRTLHESAEQNYCRSETVAAAVGEECDTIEEVYEPYLMQEGFIARTQRGRVATPRAHTHLGRARSGSLL